MFRSVPRDAIIHFKAHIDRFRGRPGFKELIFEHYAWLSLQYSAFAELFCDAIKSGLPALQTQHPGIYYHKAAEYVGQRKEAFYECLKGTDPSEQANNANTYANQFYSEFFGVRTTKVGDAATEQLLFTVARANERNFNHSVCFRDHFTIHLPYYSFNSLTGGYYLVAWPSHGPVQTVQMFTLSQETGR